MIISIRGCSADSPELSGIARFGCTRSFRAFTVNWAFKSGLHALHVTLCVLVSPLTTSASEPPCRFPYLTPRRFLSVVSLPVPPPLNAPSVLSSLPLAFLIFSDPLPMWRPGPHTALPPPTLHVGRGLMGDRRPHDRQVRPGTRDAHTPKAAGVVLMPLHTRLSVSFRFKDALDRSKTRATACVATLSHAHRSRYSPLPPHGLALTQRGADV
ncbi:hypothetical protein B0H13DRAFT_2305605 [Mycena leptocephala]|nr:hypothetical protein B0H13DRAFT_2305605 [Mycena leptocephala]